MTPYLLDVKIPDNLKPCNIAFVNWNNSLLYQHPAKKASLYVCPDVHIIRVDSIPENYIEVVKSANAATRYEARQKAQSLSNGYTMSDSATIMLQPMEFNKYSKWSSEMIDIYIYLPRSTAVNMY